jgi:DNA-binding NarL/FixJ family response regulator
VLRSATDDLAEVDGYGPGVVLEGAESSVTVVVADPHSGTREAIAHLLRAQPGLSVVAEAADRAATARLLVRHRPSVLVLDPAVLRRDGLGSLSLLQAASPSTRVLATGMGDADAWSNRLRSYGCAGYVTKNASPDVWLCAVRGAADSTVSALQTGLR